jgi:hypothetical protein
MWILPKQLHTLASALDTEALTWDSEQLCQLYEQSLTVNGKPSRSRSFSAALKKDSWMQALSTRTLKPSLGNSFVTEYLYSAADTLVSHSQPQETGRARTTQDTSGLGLETALQSCDQASVSLRMSTDTSRWDSPQSSATWKSLVTKRRGEFSQRLKSAHLTSANESSSWPTASTRDHKGGYSGGRIRKGKISMDTLDVAVQAYSEGGLLALENPSTDGNPQELWRTPSCSDGEGGIMEMRPGTAGKYKLRDHVHAKWATPSAFDWNQPETKEQWEKRAATQAQKGVNLHLPLKSQALQVERPTEKQKITHKLNPRFVETLMGLPVGWVMPSCAEPMTTAPTSFVPSVTESSLPSALTPIES